MGKHDQRFLSLRMISICVCRPLSHGRMLNAYTQYGRQDGEETREIIQMEHRENRTSN